VFVDNRKENKDERKEEKEKKKKKPYIPTQTSRIFV
jgi:hypothetical protein